MKTNIWRMLGSLTALTLIGKIIAFLREMVIAYCFGAAFSTDAYFLAWGLIGDVLYAFTTAISVAFLPLYIESKREEKSDRFVSGTIVICGSISIGLAILIYLGAKELAVLIAPSYNEDKLRYVVLYIQILAGGMIFPLLSNIFSSILNAERIYSYTAFTGIVYSLIAIIFSVSLKDYWGVLSLVISIPIAYLLQCIVLYIRTKRDTTFNWTINLKDKYINKLLKNAVPILISNAVIEINQMVDRLLATGFGDGSVSALAYSKTLSSFINSLFASTIITVLFTELSYDSERESLSKFHALLRSGFIVLLILTIPIVMTIMFTSYDIVNIVYGRGAFDSNAVFLTARSLVCYSVAFTFTVLQAYFVKAFYALGDTRKPMEYGICCILLNIIMSIFLSQKIGFEGIAIGTSISTCVAVIILVFGLWRKLGKLTIFQGKKTIISIFFCTGVTFLCLKLVNTEISWSNSYLKFGINTLVCFAIYFVGLYLLECKEIICLVKELTNSISNKGNIRK